MELSNEDLLERLNEVELLAKAGRWQRFSHRPLTYASTLLWRHLIYAFRPKDRHEQTNTFFDAEMKVVLPAGMDIFLLGAKTHDSEIRLSRWLIRHLQAGDIFLDVGAHFGFFSLLASQLVEEGGKVFAFEAASSTFQVLQQNTASVENIKVHHHAVSDRKETLTFYEFPTRYSEYNTLEPEQFKSKPWFKKAQKTVVNTLVLDEYLEHLQVKPSCVKIDVEGAEEQVIRGLKQHLIAHPITLLVEATSLNIKTHQRMQNYLNDLQYKTFAIQADGTLKAIQNISDYLTEKNIDSDNFVFQKV
ncbi:MAG: FkbM family methyltransferase [Bacteroidota bacterium]